MLGREISNPGFRMRHSFDGPPPVAISRNPQIDLSVSIRSLVEPSTKQAIIIRRGQIINTFLRRNVQSVSLNRDFAVVRLDSKIKSSDFDVIQPLESRTTIFTKTSQELMRFYNKKGTRFIDNRQIFGLIYGIIDWDIGELVKVGRTEELLKKRKNNYLSRAKFELKTRGSATDAVSQRIIDIIKQGRNPNSVLQWVPIEITLRTGSSERNIDFDKKLIETLEQYWQNKFGTKVSTHGLDRTSGAAGPHSLTRPDGSSANILIPRIPIGWRILKSLISKGCNYDQMLNILSPKYLLGLTKSDIIDNIKYHWPFVNDQALRSGNMRPQSTLRSTRNYLIAPIIKHHVENGITNSKEIERLFKSAENPNGISVQTIIRAVRSEYQVGSWADFLKFCGASLTHTSLSKLSPQEYRDVGGQLISDYEKFLISQFIIEGRGIEYIAEQLHYSKITIQRRIVKWWGDIYKARTKLVAPILALCFEKGWKAATIRANVPFFQNLMSSSRASDAVYHYSIYFFGLKPREARIFINTHSLHEFLDTYYTYL
jgi:hypothetical protein